LTIMVAALNSKGDPTSVGAAVALGKIKCCRDKSLDTSRQFPLKNIINVQTSNGTSAAQATFARNVTVLGKDLVNLAAQAYFVNGSNFMHVTLPLTVPGVTS